MKSKCGIVCEYNPFHNGHAHHIAKTKEYDVDVVCIMSGDFVQRAQPAAFDKHDRASIALKNGADAVIELPTAYATAGGAQFARGAISILSSIKGLDYISFGIESCSKEIIEQIAEIQLSESPQFKAELSSGLKNGLSYALSYSNATLSQLTTLGINKKAAQIALSGANNVLAIEYIKAIKQKNLPIKPIFISRCDRGYNDASLIPPYASASAIRTLIESGGDHSPFVPEKCNYILNHSIYNPIMRHLLLANPPQKIDKTAQGILDNKIYSAAKKLMTVEEIVTSIKSKAFTYSHIKRRVLQLALGIKMSLVEQISSPCARLLGIKNTFKSSLKDFPATILIKGAQLQAANDPISLINRRASDLYAVITNQPATRYHNALITIK